MNKIGYSKVNNLEECTCFVEDNIYNKIFSNITLEKNIINTSFTDCEFINCIMNIKVSNSTFTNCKFINSDMSNIEFDECGLHFITISNSKLTGLELTNGVIKNSIY